ncbi:hypothetical protein MMC15_002266 [Xylographa vitiligo]|nr:hypothetical protein [Xylographa vitiligo]
MSGFEVVGVVLAVIPLFISAAEHYRDGLGSIDRFWNKERILRKYIEDLYIQQTLLRQTLQGVLVDVDIDASIKSALLEEPASNAWQKAFVQQKIAERLGPVHEAFMILLKRLDHALIGQLKRSSKLSFYKESDVATQLISSTNVKSLHDELQRRQNNSRLDGHELWNCVKFTWKEPLRNEMLQEIKECNSDIAKLCKSLQSSPPLRNEQRKHRAEAVFREDLLPTKEPRVRIQVQPHLSENKSSRKALEDVCAAIKHAFVNDKPLELIINDKNQVWEVPQQNLCKWNIPREPKILTLQSILSEFPQYLKKRWLAKEKAILAVVLAHSLLQLHESIWLRRYWTTEHISFLIDKDFAFTKTSRFALKSPCVSTQIKQAALSNSEMADTGQLKQMNHPIPTLMALGIVLLELHLNATITGSIGSSTGDLRSRALEVLDECYDEMTDNYHQDICFCIFLLPASPSRANRSFDNPEFRDWYYQQVITPLETNLSDNFDIENDEWSQI